MSIARHGLRVFFTNWLAFPLQFLTGVVVIRVIGAEGKGLLVLLTASAGIMAMLAQLGMPASGVYLLRSGRHSARSLLAHFSIWTAAVTLVFASLGLAGYRAFTELFLDGLGISSVVALLVLISVPAQLLIAFTTNLLLAQAAVQQYAMITLTLSAGTLALTLVLVVALPLGLTGALAAAVAPQVAAAAYGAACVRRGERAPFHRGVFRDLLRVGAGHYAGTVGSQMFKRLDSFLLAYFLGAGPVGYYSVAMTAYESLLSIPRALSAILAGEASARGAAGAAAVSARASRVVLAIMLLAGVMLSVASLWIVPLVYGADFIRAVSPLQILLAAAALIGTTITLQAYFLGIGKPGVGGVLTLLSGALNLLFSVGLIPVLGIVGNAFATVLAALISLILHVWFFRKLSGTSVADVLLPGREDAKALLNGLRNVAPRARPLARKS